MAALGGTAASCLGRTPALRSVHERCPGKRLHQIAASRPVPGRRREALTCRAERRPPAYEVSSMSLIVGLGLGQMVNAGVYRAVYCTSPTMQLIAARLDEVQPPFLHTFMGKFGAFLMNPFDILFLMGIAIVVNYLNLFD